MNEEVKQGLEKWVLKVIEDRDLASREEWEALPEIVKALCSK